MTSKVIAVTMNDRALVALCADGSVWAVTMAQMNGLVTLDGTSWTCLVEAANGTG